MTNAIFLSTMYKKARLAELIRSNALKFGDFTLASGKKATYYLDCRKLTLNGEAANLIAAGILDAIADDVPDCVGGMAIGADPITAAVVTCAWQRGLSIDGFIVRKEPKQHGTGQQVEGPVAAGQRALIVEDVITSGGSSLLAIEHARSFGLVVDRVIAIVDRGDTSAEIFANAEVKFSALFHVSELLNP
jgi:orotate phosphoribosyltransferase